MENEFNNGVEYEKERIVSAGDKFFIGNLYDEDSVTTNEYDKIVKLWEKFKDSL